MTSLSTMLTRWHHNYGCRKGSPIGYTGKSYPVLETWSVPGAGEVVDLEGEPAIVILLNSAFLLQSKQLSLDPDKCSPHFSEKRLFATKTITRKSQSIKIQTSGAQAQMILHLSSETTKGRRQKDFKSQRKQSLLRDTVY